MHQNVFYMIEYINKTNLYMTLTYTDIISYLIVIFFRNLNFVWNISHQPYKYNCELSLKTYKAIERHAFYLNHFNSVFSLVLCHQCLSFSFIPTSIISVCLSSLNLTWQVARRRFFFFFITRFFQQKFLSSICLYVLLMRKNSKF